MSKILLIAEHSDGALRKSTLQSLTLTRDLAAARGGSFSVAILGAGVSGLANELAAYGADKVYVMDGEPWSNYLAQAWTTALHSLIGSQGFDGVVCSSGTFGKDLLPRLAMSEGWGMVADCVGLEADGGQVLYKRPMYAGNVIATVKVNTPGVVVSVRASEFDAAEATGGSSAVEAFDAGHDAQGTAFVGFEGVVSERPDLGEAERVVSGGRGLKDGEQFFQIMNPLADAMDAGLGASRAAVDSGFCPNDLQIGQTGKVVAPKLYVAVALSGAIQHLAGMKNSKCIVAINKDPDAPIFQVADYGLVGDAFKVVPELVSKLG